MIRAGRLRHFVTIEQSVSQRTETGAERIAWVPIATNVPCGIESVSGREFFTANQEQRDVTARLVMRRFPGLTTKMRIVYGGAVYDIKAILPDPTQASHIQLMCTTGASPG